MPDVEKVIKALECISNGAKQPCRDCEYSKREEWCIAECAKDALALLKAQEPVMVEERADTDTINCPKCGQQFARVGRDKSIYLDTDEEPNYCPKCGQAVKWE
jgi:hypothetical protein